MKNEEEERFARHHNSINNHNHYTNNNSNNYEAVRVAEDLTGEEGDEDNHSHHTNPSNDMDFDPNDDSMAGLNLPSPDDGDRDLDQDMDSPGSSAINRKRRLMKKAPDAPKRFKSAYICFVTDKMEDVKKNLPPDMKVTEIMKTLAYMWKNLPPLERLEYEKIAEADKSRYFDEMAHYSGPLQVPNKRQKKPAGAPKRAMSAFLSFSQQMRPQIRALYPELKNTDISGVLAQKWHTANEEEKRPHIERELKEREKYHEDMAQWKEEETRRQLEAQEKKRANARNTIDFLDLPSSAMIWESLENDIISENGGGQGTGCTASEKEMNAFWEDMSSTNSNNGATSNQSSNKNNHNPKNTANATASSSSSKAQNQNQSQSQSHSSSNKSRQGQPKGSLKTSNNNNNEGEHDRRISKQQQQQQQNQQNQQNQMGMYHQSVASSSGAGGPGSSNQGRDGNSGRGEGSSNNYHENRFYAVPFPMPSAPEGQIPYAAFNLYNPEYALPPGYFASANDGGNAAYGARGGIPPGYPYPIHPFYARMAQDKESASMPRYPYGYPGHPGFPPPDHGPVGGGEGYWQWRKYPLPPNAQMKVGGGGSGNGGGNNGDGNGKTGNSQIPPYFYDLNYLQMLGQAKNNNNNNNNNETDNHKNEMNHQQHQQQHQQQQHHSSSTSSSSQQKSNKKKSNNKNSSNTSSSSSSHNNNNINNNNNQFHLLAPPPPLPLLVPSSTSYASSPQAQSNGMNGNSNSSSNAQTQGNGSQHQSDKYNPLSTVADTLRAIQRSGLSGQD